MKTRQLTVALILLTAISLSLTQNLAFADDHKSQGTITIIANGTATPIGLNETLGSPTTAWLFLSGSISSGDETKINFIGLTGNLHIGQTTYQIPDGQGQADANGTFAIQANSTGSVGNGNQTSDDHMEILLQGSMQGNNVTFDPKQSTLASLYSLALSGQVDIYLFSTSNASSSPSTSETSGNETSSVETSSVTNNITQVVTQENTALTQTEATNNSVSETIGNQQVRQTPAQQNPTTTVTVTQEQTFTQTETVTSRNMTTTITETTTVANVTITATATVTVANQTITVTTTTT